MSGIIFLVILVVIAVVLISSYNALVQLRVRCDSAWSDIDVQLKRRHDLIPNLVETVKGYATHEKGTFVLALARAPSRSAAPPCVVSWRRDAESAWRERMRTPREQHSQADEDGITGPETDPTARSIRGRPDNALSHSYSSELNCIASLPVGALHQSQQSKCSSSSASNSSSGPRSPQPADLQGAGLV